MDAADLFGGEVSSSVPPAGSSGSPSANEPLSAASLFGGTPESESTAMTGSLKRQEPQVQDMPDDLFGSGGDIGGSPFDISANSHVHPQSHHSPGAGTLPAVRSVPAMEHVPDGLFGSGSNEERNSLGFSVGSSTWSKSGTDVSPEPALAAFGGGRAPSSSHDFWEAPPSTSDRNGLGSEVLRDAGPPSGWSVDTSGAHPEDMFAQSAPVSFGGAFQGAGVHDSHGESFGHGSSSPPFDAVTVPTRDDDHQDGGTRAPQLPPSVNLNPSSPQFGAPPTNLFGAPPSGTSGKEEDLCSPETLGVSSPLSNSGPSPPPGAIVFGDRAPPPSGSRCSSLQSPPPHVSVSPPREASGGPQPPLGQMFPSGESKLMGDSQGRHDASRSSTLNPSWQSDGFVSTQNHELPVANSLSGVLRSEASPPQPPPPMSSEGNAYAFSAPLSSSSPVGAVMDSGGMDGKRWDVGGHGDRSNRSEGQHMQGTMPFDQQGTLRSPAEEMFGVSSVGEDESSVPWWQAGSEEAGAEEQAEQDEGPGTEEVVSSGSELAQEGAAGPNETRAEEMEQSLPDVASVGGIESQATVSPRSQAFGAPPVASSTDEVREPSEEAAGDNVAGAPTRPDAEDRKALDFDDECEGRGLAAREGEIDPTPGAVGGGLFTVAEDSAGYDGLPNQFSPIPSPSALGAGAIPSGTAVKARSSFAPRLFSTRSDSWCATQPSASMTSSGTPESVQNGRLFASATQSNVGPVQAGESRSSTPTSREGSLSPPPTSLDRWSGARGLGQTHSSFYDLKDRCEGSYSNLFRPRSTSAVQGVNPGDQATTMEVSVSELAATESPLVEDAEEQEGASESLALTDEHSAVPSTRGMLAVSLDAEGERLSVDATTCGFLGSEGEGRNLTHAEAREPKEDAGCDDVKVVRPTENLPDPQLLLGTVREEISQDAHQHVIVEEVKTVARQVNSRQEAMTPKRDSSEDIKTDGHLSEAAQVTRTPGSGVLEEKEAKVLVGCPGDDKLNGGLGKDDDECDIVAMVVPGAVDDGSRVNSGADSLEGSREVSLAPSEHAGGSGGNQETLSSDPGDAEAKREVYGQDDVKDEDLRHQEREHGVGEPEEIDDGDENELSVAETTASDFFAPPGAGDPDEDVPDGSPRPISRCDSRASMSSMVSAVSVGQVSVDSLGSRRLGNAGSGPVGRVRASPFAVPDGPPIFPLGNYPRARRPSFEGLPPPLPPVVPSAPSTADSDRPSRNSWRSLSPARITPGDKDRWSMSPSVRYRQMGSPADGLNHGNVFSAPRLGGVGALGLPNRVGSPAITAPFPSRSPSAPLLHDPARASERDRRPIGDSGTASRFRRSTQGPVMAYRERSSEFRPTSRPLTGSTDAEASRPTGYDVLVRPSFCPSRTAGNDAAAPFQERTEDAFTPLHLEAKGGNRTSRPGDNSRGRSAPANDENTACVGGTMADVQKDPTRGGSGDSDQTAALSSATGERSERDECDGTPGDDRVDESALKDTPLEGEALVASFVNEGSGETPRESGSQMPRPQLSKEVFGSCPTEFGLSARPSPLVNTSSPLTAPPEGSRPSLFSEDDGYVAVDANGSTSDAADVFATEAPAGTADALFGEHASSNNGVVSEQPIGRNGGRMARNTPADDPFSQGPPREAPVSQPVSSLPNPWGSSPLKQPLPAPKAWPTTGGTGFDRPAAPAATQATISVPLRASSAEGGNAIPAAFLDPESNGRGVCDTGQPYFSQDGKGQGLEADEGSPPYGVPPGAASSKNPGTSAGVVPLNAPRPWENKSGDTPSSSSGSAKETWSQGFVRRSVGHYGSSSSVSSVPSARQSVDRPFKPQSNGGATGWGSESTMHAARAVSGGAARDPTRKPPGVIARFGFGGRLVCMHPRRKMRLAPSSGVKPSIDETGVSHLRKGPVKIWVLKDLISADTIVRDVSTFPGPASSADPNKVKEYAEKRASGDAAGQSAEHENAGIRLLWTVAALALRFKGQLTSETGAADSSSPEAALVNFLKEAHARAKGAACAKMLGSSTTTPASSECAAPAGAGMSPGNLSWPAASNAALAFPGSMTGTMAGPAAPDADMKGNFPMVRPAGVPAPFALSPGVGSVGGVGARADHAAPGEDSRHVETPERVTGSREEVEGLLVDGKKDEAVEASIRAGLWGLALLIAAQCPSSPESQAPYQRVVRLYANAFLQSGTPLYTMALAFSGQAADTIKHGGKSLCGMTDRGHDGITRARVGGPAGGSFEENWPTTAAAIISNKVSGWTEQLIALGDRLVELDNVPAAHALFLVAGLQVEMPNTKDGRMALPGVDHRKPAHRILRTRAATEAVHVLEVLEVASEGNRGPNSAVQGHKLRLAMRLADIGYLDKAAQYARSAQEEVALIKEGANSGSGQQSPYSPQFLKALDDFEERVCTAQGLPVLVTKLRPGGRGEKGSPGTGAGGWLINRVTRLVISSATPGPTPVPKAAQHPSPASGDGQTSQVPSPGDLPGSGMRTHGRGLAPPQAPLPTPYQAPLSSGEPRPRPAPGPFPSNRRGPRPFSGAPPAPRPSGVQSPGWGIHGGGMSSLGSAGGFDDSTHDGGMTPGDKGKASGPSYPVPSAPSASDLTDISLATNSKGGEAPRSETRQRDESPSVVPLGKQSGKSTGSPEPPDRGNKDPGDDKAGGKNDSKDKPTAEVVAQKRELKKRESAVAAVGTQPGRLAKMVTKWLYPEAKHADVGNKMEAYYDNKEKRWVFPDETPEDIAAARPSAPPTAAQLGQSASPAGPTAASAAPAPTPGLDANDPLAALMAPPKSTIQSARRHSPAVGHAAGGGPPSGSLNWSSMAPPLSGGLSARSPFPPAGKHLTAFAPKIPAGSTSSNPSGGAGPSTDSTDDSQPSAAS